MELKELIEEIIDLMNNMDNDLLKSIKNKAAAQRARVKSIKLAKLMKKFRKQSTSITPDEQ